jgi:hypothetical protein
VSARSFRSTDDRLRPWLRAYQGPLWLTAAFLLLLTLFALTPEPRQTAAETSSDQTSVEPTPGPHECVVCDIDKTCDPKSGRCMFVDATPLPCVEGARFDDKAGFCLPTGTPAVVAPEPTGLPPGQFPGGGFGDLPGINNHPERDRNGSIGN